MPVPNRAAGERPARSILYQRFVIPGTSLVFDTSAPARYLAGDEQVAPEQYVRQVAVLSLYRVEDRQMFLA